MWGKGFLPSAIPFRAKTRIAPKLLVYFGLPYRLLTAKKQTLCIPLHREGITQCSSPGLHTLQAHLPPAWSGLPLSRQNISEHFSALYRATENPRFNYTHKYTPRKLCENSICMHSSHHPQLRQFPHKTVGLFRKYKDLRVRKPVLIKCVTCDALG